MIDANSLLTLTRELGEDVVDVLEGNFTAALAPYEIGNALWKECNLLEEFSLENAIEIFEFTSLMMGSMKVIHLDEDNLGGEVLRTANKLNITYYDATYLTIARRLKKTLVTDDGKLRKTAKRTDVKTMNSNELIKK